MHIILKNKKIYFNKYKVKCSIGKRGISKFKKEGDKMSPSGNFKLLYIMYRKDRVRKIKSKLKKIIIKKNMGWCDDVGSKYYNKLIKYPFNGKSERLFKKDHTYDIIIVLDYNLKPIKKNKGSAIFLHIVKKDYKPTLGCVAVSKKDMRLILGCINQKSEIIIR